MRRRYFVDITGKSVLLTALFNNCGFGKSLPDRHHLVDTQGKREAYLEKMLKALCTDIGPHPIGSPAYNKAASIVKKEMELALPVVELDTFTFERWLLKGEPTFYGTVKNNMKK